MRSLVTGCAGFIGSHLCERLLAAGETVVGIDSLAPTYDSFGRMGRLERLDKAGDFEFVAGDLIEVDLRPLVADVDVVYHLAARPGVRASWADFRQAADANILATQKVLGALSHTPGKRLVFASSSSVYGRPGVFPTPEDHPLAPISPYGVTKAAGEALVDAYVSEYGVDAYSLRYFTVFGPRQRSDMAFTRWIRAALEKRPLPLFGDGTAVRDFTFVADVVEATILAASGPAGGHTVLNVAGGSPVSVMEVLGIIGQEIGRPIEVDQLPVAKGDPPETGGDTTRIKQLLGWKPTWGIKEGIAAQVAWAKKRFGSATS